MFYPISSSLPQRKKIVLLIFGIIVCLVSDTGVPAITATVSSRIAASPTGNIISRPFVHTADNAVRAPNQGRTLTFAERVSYQRAIEDVYWRHRIWPRSGGERPEPKPSLDAVVTQGQLEHKVADYLRKSQALEDYRHRPITADQLQAEMDRMAQHTKQPEVLRELFEALGNDPFVIAECLATPVLSQRMVAKFYADDKEPLDFSLARPENQMPKLMAAASANYTLPTISD